MLIISVIAVIVSAVLWVIGGKTSGRLRDMTVPFILGLAVLIKTNILIGILTAGCLQMIRLGYGNYSPEDDDKPCLLARLTHDRKGCIIRALWGLLVGIVGYIPLFFYAHNPLYYFLYVSINTIMGYLVCEFEFDSFLTDALVALGVSAIVFLA